MNKRLLENMMNIGRSLSKDIEGREFRHISFIIRKGIIVSVGTNAFKSHPLAKKYGYRFNDLHSELSARLKLRSDFNKLVLVNFRFNKEGLLRQSKPCEKCMNWCYDCFDKIYYSNEDGMYVLNKDTMDGIPINNFSLKEELV